MVRAWIRALVLALLAAQVLIFAAGQGDGPVFSGQIPNWDGGEARLAAISFTEDAPLGTIAEGTIAVDGTFELRLPAEVPAALLTPLDAAEICPEAPEGLTLSPESFMGAGVFALGVGEDEAMMGFLAQASSEAVALEQEGSAQVGDFAVFYVYAAETVSVRGECVRESETETINLDLQAGWNTLVSTSTEVADGAWSAMETTVGEAPSGAGWYYVSMAGISEGEAPEAVFKAMGEDFEGPDTLTAGFVQVTVNNEGEGGYTVLLLRPKEGASVEEVVAAVEAVDRAFAGEGDPTAALNAALELADVVAETFVEPGGSNSFGVVLEEGRYIAYGTAEPAEEGVVPVASQRVYEVAGEPQAEAPQADQTVRMVDFAFALPAGIQAGEQVWEVVNVGQQLHHMILYRLQDGKTLDDFTAWMETEGEGEPPADEAGAVGLMSTGQTNYVELDLGPGDYVAICFMFDHAGEATGQPHYMLGMMQTFTVAGE